MNTYFILAAVLTVLIGPLHSVLGERKIFRELFQGPLPKIAGSESLTRQTLRLFWHLIGVFWLGLAALLAYFASLPDLDPSARMTAATIGFLFLVSSAASILATRGRHFSWAPFLAVAASVWLGLA